MGEPDSLNVVMGVFRYCEQTEIPADNQAIQKAFFKLSQWYPDAFSEFDFNEDGVSQYLENAVESLMLAGLIGMSGEKLETLIINPYLINHFDGLVSKLFSNCECIEIMKIIGKDLPKLLKKNESVRYRKLTTK